MKTIKNQKGLTLISWLIVIVFVLFQAVMAMAVLPVYITDRSVSALLKELPQDINARSGSKRDLRILLLKRLRMNSIYNIKSDKISIKKKRNVYIVEINYEPRGTLIGNLEYIVKFEHKVKVPINAR